MCGMLWLGVVLRNDSPAKVYFFAEIHKFLPLKGEFLMCNWLLGGGGRGECFCREGCVCAEKSVILREF